MINFIKYKILKLKSADEKFKDIGFEKISEDESSVEYRRLFIDKNGIECFQTLEIQTFSISDNKKSIIVYSYQTDKNKDGYNNALGIPLSIMKLCISKAKEKGLSIWE
jgi:hypothetical protein